MYFGYKIFFASSTLLSPEPGTSQSIPIINELAQPKLSAKDVKLAMDEMGIKYIVGTVTNPTNKTLSYVQVEINLYDSSGAQVGSTMDNINNLEPRKTWKFKAVIMEDSAKSFKVKNITAY